MPGASGEVLLSDGRRVGVLGFPARELLKDAGLKSVPVYGELDLDAPWEELTTAQQRMVIAGRGAKSFDGVAAMIQKAHKKARRSAARSHLAEFIDPATCTDCDGARLSPESRAVYFHGLSIADLNAFDITHPREPEHLWAAEAAGGAHHLVFSPDGSRAYVQNSLLNIEGMNDGSISVIDLQSGEKIDSIDTFKDAGLTINTIVLTPEAEDFHSH